MSFKSFVLLYFLSKVSLFSFNFGLGLSVFIVYWGIFSCKEKFYFYLNLVLQ